jgi:O-antigen/teichoic acid export membrane protein
MLQNIRNAFKHTVIYSIGNLSTKLVGFILLPLYTSYLSVAEYGILGLLEVTSIVLVQTFQFSLYAAYQRWYYDKDYSGKQKEIFFTVILFLIILNVFLFGLLLNFSKDLSILLFNKPEFSYIIKIMFAVSFLQIINSLPQTLMRIQEKSTFFVATNCVKLISTLILTIVFITKFQRSLNGIYEAQLIGFIVYFLFVFRYLRNNMKFKLELSILKEMLSFSLPLVMSTVSGLVLTTVDRYCLRFLGKADALVNVGLYTMGYKISNVLKLFVIDSFKMALPAITFKMMDKENNKRFYSKLLTYFAFVIVFCVLGMTFFGRELIKCLSRDQQYWTSYNIIPIITFSFIFLGMTNVINMGLAIVKKTKIIAIIVSAVSVLNLTLNILLIPVWQFIGAAVASLISHFVFFLIADNYAQKHYFVPYEIGKIVKMISVSIILIGISFLTVDLNLFLRLLIKFSMLLSFPVIMYFLKFYEEIELLRLKQGWIKWRDPGKWRSNFEK